MMNTVLKGDNFEKLALKLIMEKVESGEIALLRDCCTFHYKPKYYSEKRKSNIVFDLSIEIKAKGAETYQMLYLIECKDYSGTIPVSDIEEFSSKITQVAGKNVKGIFITTAELQEGALNYIKSEQMMFIKVSREQEAKILLHNVLNSNGVDSKIPWSLQIDSLLANIDPDRENKSNLPKWDVIIKTLIITSFDPKKIESIPFSGKTSIEKLSKDYLEKAALSILEDFDFSVLKGYSPLNPTKFIDYMLHRYGISLEYDEMIDGIDDDSLRGYCNPSTKKIFISPSIKNTDKFLFVCMHEIAHIVLHREVRIPQSIYDSLPSSVFDYKTNKYKLTNDKNWLEWQANQFSTSVLLPKESVLLRLVFWQTQHGISKKGFIHLDNQDVNKLAYRNVTQYLCSFFNVSATVLKYRLDDLGLIRYSITNPVDWRDILNGEKRPEFIGDIVRYAVSKISKNR